MTGRVVKFDSHSGYGFVRPDDGGDDVFLHVNDLTFDKSFVAPGLALRFRVADSPRGRKAFDVELVANPDLAATLDARSPVGVGRREGEPVALSSSAFKTEVTELLLAASPDMTTAEVLQVRQRFLQFAADHGWIRD